MTDCNIIDLNILMSSFLAAFKCCKWKRAPQKFEADFLSELVKLKEELQNQTYQVSECNKFLLKERGRQRYIFNLDIRDRVIRHALCDNILHPNFKPYLIYTNSASQKGKGLSFARKQFEKDLHNFYLEYGSNDGYVGFVDLSKFYDNIRHDKLKQAMYPKIPEQYYWIMDKILEAFEVDVSYMTDEEFANCLNQKFNQIEHYQRVISSQNSKQKMMKKSVGIGDQISQDIGIFFPTPVDNYTKIVRSCKGYGRYSDDMYIICKSKSKLLSIISGIKEQAEKLGLFINPKKTRIYKLSQTYKYLQIKYSLTNTGKVVKRINPQTFTRERKRLRAYKKLLDQNRIKYSSIQQAYKSWMGNYYKLMSKKQITRMKNLYINLFGEDLRWKQQ